MWKMILCRNISASSLHVNSQALLKNKQNKSINNNNKIAKATAQDLPLPIFIDNVSWRDITKGSLFIAQLISCFQNYSWCCHLEEVFRKVSFFFPFKSLICLVRLYYYYPLKWQWQILSGKQK